MSEFHTIRNLVSQAINHRVGEGQFSKIFGEMHQDGVDDVTRDRLLTVIVVWIEHHEKECGLTKTPENATVKG